MTKKDEQINNAYVDGTEAFKLGRERIPPSPVPWGGYSDWWKIGYDNARLDSREAAREGQLNVDTAVNNTSDRDI